jgi:hypothetical protein
VVAGRVYGLGCRTGKAGATKDVVEGLRMMKRVGFETVGFVGVGTGCKCEGLESRGVRLRCCCFDYLLEMVIC